MMRLTAFAIALAAAGAALGIYQSSGGAEASEGSAGAQWRTPAAPVDYSRSSQQFVHSLERSNIYMMRPTAPADAAAATPSSTFPVILSVAVIDGKPSAILRNPDAGRLTVTAGAELPNGWKIKSITLQQIVAERNGEEVTFDVYRRAPN